MPTALLAEADQILGPDSSIEAIYKATMAQWHVPEAKLDCGADMACGGAAGTGTRDGESEEPEPLFQDAEVEAHAEQPVGNCQEL